MPRRKRALPGKSAQVYRPCNVAGKFAQHPKSCYTWYTTWSTRWSFLYIFGILRAEGIIVSGDAELPAWADTWVKDLARRIEALGLSPVALPLLEIARALGFLGSQVLLVAQPLLTGLVNDVTLERTAAFLDHPELLDRLRAQLEGEEG